MQFFKRIFNKKNSDSNLMKVRFGRYTDAYKTEQQYDAWDRAIQLFEEEDYLLSYETFFGYLRDEQEDNVRLEKNDGKLLFEILQGSRKITGMATHKKVRAFSKVAKPKSLHGPYMKRLLEQNFDLKFSRFCMDEDGHIAITFDTYTIDGSPYKLYYALKELSTHADKQDDLLFDEFDMSEAEESSSVTHLPQKEKEIKYQYIQKALKEVIEEVEKGQLNPIEYAGGITYMMLNLVYKLDFLICPEGFMMEALERIHRLYFAKNDVPTVEKNQELLAELKKLQQRDKEEYFKEMYKVVSTFGITTAVNYSRVVHFIEGELSNMHWYQDNGYDKVACAVPGYIVGYCLFNYAVPEPCKDFFQLYYQIVEPDYFEALGFPRLYQPNQKTFNKKAIKKAIDFIVNKYSPWFKELKPNLRKLNFESMSAFTQSYLKMMEVLDMTKTG